MSKLPLELEAVKALGSDHLNTELIEQSEETEVIAQHYEARAKY